MHNHGPTFDGKQLFLASSIDHSVNDRIKNCKPLTD